MMIRRQKEWTWDGIQSPNRLADILLSIRISFSALPLKYSNSENRSFVVIYPVKNNT